MADAGLSNLDMEMIKFTITCLKVYYPGLIDYMLIFQMPFIFNGKELQNSFNFLIFFILSCLEDN
jgi:hypothetical protein